MKKIKKILPLLTSLTMLSGPVLLIIACDNERDMNNLPNGKIPDQYKNRVLFSFLGVNFNKTIDAQFKDTYSQGLDFILQDVEGKIAQQKFYEFFHNKLNYTADTTDADGNVIKIGEANAAFIKLKDDLGLNLLTQKYLSGINSADSLDKISAADNNELLFQNQSWHQDGTSKFSYQNVKFYTVVDEVTKKSNDPDQIFTPDSLYQDYGSNEANAAFDAQLANIAKHPDDNYSTDLTALLPNNAKKWNSSAGINNTQKQVANNDIPLYSKYLKRFQWWLRFRYQQYYQYEILPKLNQTLFTMSYILDNILDIKNNGSVKPIISTPVNNVYISQLQGTNFHSGATPQLSNYNITWNFTTNLANAQSIDKKWNDSPSQPPAWESIVKLKDNSSEVQTLNPDFFTQLANTGSAATIKEIDPNFGVNGFLNQADNKQEMGRWVTNGGLHYTTNNNIATFTYSTPIYFLNLIQNLDFSFLKEGKEDKNEGWIPEISNLIQDWNNSGNASITKPFSNYIKGGKLLEGKEQSDITQERKWNIFWQMLYSISASSDEKDSPAATNFKIAAQNLFPIYIPKNNIYEEGFWSKVKEYYS